MSNTRVTHDVVANVGEYKDPQTGEMKKRRKNVGVVFTRQDGSMSIKLDSIPVGQEWSGWLSLYPKDNNQQQGQQRQQPQQQPQQQYQGYNPNQPQATGDDIPF